MAAAGATPEEFGLKVRAHPDTLMVTARNKMGSSEEVVVSIGLANHFAETAILVNDGKALDQNRRAARRLAEDLKAAGRPLESAVKVTGGLLLREVPVSCVRRLVRGFTNHQLSMLTDPGPVDRYIAERDMTELATWDVLFPSIEQEDDTLLDTSLGVPIRCQRRSAGRKSDGATIRVTNKQRVASRGVEKTGLSEEAIQTAESGYRALQPNRNDPDAVWNYPDRIYRTQRTQPLLIVHLLQILKDKKPLHLEPVVAWSISFPGTQLPEQRVQYVVNTTWLRENFRDEADDEELESELA
jgi:hypothetical protein